MKTEINQKISQFLDRDLDSTEEENLLLKMSKDPELIKKLNCYQTVNQALKNNDFVRVNEGFLDKIKEQIDQEPHYLLPKQKVKKSQLALWQKASVAIAASTVIAAVLVSQKIELINNKAQPGDSLVEQQLVKSESINVKDQKDEIKIDLASDVQEIQHERLKAYLETHSDNLYTYDSLGFQPYARVVSQD